jgi:outer membrane phospholipase A
MLSLTLACVVPTLFPAVTAQAAEGEAELLHLYQYKPLYFLMGNPYTKIELSFKVQLHRRLPLYAGYTQLMFWDLFVRSPAFHDIDYRPEVFYRLQPGGPGGGRLNWLDLGFYEHESNGVGGINERSWNRSYLRYHDQWKFANGLGLIGELTAWAILSTHDNNPDIARYRGRYELSLTLTGILGSRFELSDLALRLYPGGASGLDPFGGGGQELTLRAKAAYRDFMPLFVAQVFHGEGESLIDYPQSRWGFRAGFGF